MNLDRYLQKQVLEKLAKQYPGVWYLSDEDWRFVATIGEVKLHANMMYLHGHGLIDYKYEYRPQSERLGRSSITVKGLDFLEQDGGLSAILGTVTVKLHADTIRDMLEAKIMSSQLPSEEKKHFIDTLKELPAEALKTFTNKLVELACENPQAVFTTLQNIAN